MFTSSTAELLFPFTLKNLSNIYSSLARLHIKITNIFVYRCFYITYHSIVPWDPVEIYLIVVCVLMIDPRFHWILDTSVSRYDNTFPTLYDQFLWIFDPPLNNYQANSISKNRVYIDSIFFFHVSLARYCSSIEHPSNQVAAKI